MEPIQNKVAESEIEVFNLEDLSGVEDVIAFDIQPYLYKGLILKELDFRQALKALDWEAYRGKTVAVFCSADAVIPTWAYMLIASRLESVDARFGAGTREEVVRDGFVAALSDLDWSVYQDKIVVVKGCSSKTVPLNAYLLAIGHLQGVARKLMYGEPCSSVPIWRRPKPASATASKAVPLVPPNVTTG